MAAPHSVRQVASAVLLAMLLGACSVRPEEPVIQQFFAASRLRDLTALQKFSTVVFEPATDGIVRRFTIESATGAAAGAPEVVRIRADVARPDGTTRRETIDVALEHRGADWRVTGFSRRP